MEHFAPAVGAGADAVLAASVFHSAQLTVGDVKRAMLADGIAVREGDFLLHFPGTFCGLSPSGVYTDSHLLECLHRVIVHFVAAV